MMTTVLLPSERKGKRLDQCQTVQEIEQWLGPRWKLVDPDTALDEIKKPNGHIRVELQK